MNYRIYDIFLNQRVLLHGKGSTISEPLVLFFHSRECMVYRYLYNVLMTIPTKSNNRYLVPV